MSSNRRPLGVKSAIPTPVLDELLWPRTGPAPKTQESVFTHLAPVAIAMEALEHTDETVEWVLRDALSWLRAERGGRPLPVPTDEEFRARYGADDALVLAIWPVIRFVDAFWHRTVPVDRLWKEAMLLLDFLVPWDRSPPEWQRLIERVVHRNGRRLRGHDLESVTNEIALRISGTRGRMALGYSPTGDPDNVFRYFRFLVLQVARDLKIEVDPRAGTVDVESGGGPSSLSLVAEPPLRPSTLRSAAYKEALSTGGDITRLRAERSRRARHQPQGGLSLTEIATKLRRPLSTVRGAVAALTQRGALPAPRHEGRARVYSATCLPTIRKELGMRHTRDHEGTRNALTVAEVARRMGVPARDIILAVREICADADRDVPIVRRTYRLSEEWVTLLRAHLRREVD